MGCTQRVLAYDGHDVMKYGVFRDALSDFDYFDFVCRGFRRKKNRHSQHEYSSKFSGQKTILICSS